jgi:hypothetical protein
MSVAIWEKAEIDANYESGVVTEVAGHDVFGEKSSAAHHTRGSLAGANFHTDHGAKAYRQTGFAGRWMVNAVPMPGVLRTSIQPPWAATR